MKENTVVDFIAIGVGPFNLGLACLTAPIKEVTGIFLDKQEKFNWHPGMLLEDTTLQVPFMADLVTLADPTSPFSFLNYIKEQGRMYSFYIRENFLLLRNEYNHYCQWAIEKLPNVYFNTEVTHIAYEVKEELYIVTSVCTKTEKVKVYKAKKIILGTGTHPYIPECCKKLKGKAIHSSQYLDHKKELQQKEEITILGSGQSAAEIFFDLLQDLEEKEYQLNWITRSPRFFPLEYSKLTLEMTSPEYVDYFYNLPAKKRDDLIKNQKHLYKGINQDLIGAIHDALYAKRVVSKEPLKVSLRTNTELKEAQLHNDDTIHLELHQIEQDKYFKVATKGLVLATGYHYELPEFLKGISNRIRWDDQNRFDVQRNYSIDKGNNEIFVQNAELHTHGFVTPDLGMVAYRNSYIIKEITGVEHYPIEKRIAFQQFEVTEEEEIKLNAFA
ncbi:lysine N(6)-hydroxylase/L-ornithine N(5)-oxygenase family protein [Tenacibaculum maritimum]|uniref:lysine N(6)-hydroxylase/L-ornithine N(5)-oxygenase family protein n=1 Tax=Tenacibaculum maritimum TaxID=107401 RepID=UPI0012E5582F|nr:lysine N(6)-hydroxylase/L-ornithine N(5)-oxygenase family protein [Tenacibaculum maritimum]MCD9584098.1 lysine N(6)-hydroxylase/L-ornithine N(5)-oxygenase family protein [Tenacibaculum maritimum]MCD9610944.1 lysine N(6)-hydroxylase/L-ornithine N(5)-oxygenase family protein [Tenacibaculum maritimum]MCD9619890.1 lysine N(6)-hydroxylase/L-ornithine N(5)-oxygenase family protein [Tenacibaculum maritimum]MCD9627387.1 lysine N(6)-hydroxylase/L-ornithine N(5)-oxygenase family protein [Tenacibaculum